MPLSTGRRFGARGILASSTAQPACSSAPTRQNDHEEAPPLDKHVAAQLVEALNKDPVSGWTYVKQALPALGITGAELRALAREIDALIRIRRRWERCRRRQAPLAS